jgi:hypothetical protein
MEGIKEQFEILRRAEEESSLELEKLSQRAVKEE